MDFFRDEFYAGGAEAAYDVCRRVIPAGANPITLNSYPDYDRKWVARWKVFLIQLEMDRAAVNSPKQGQIIVLELLINGNIARSLIRLKTAMLSEGGRPCVHLPGGVECAGVAWSIYASGGGLTSGDHVCTKVAYEPVIFQPGERRRDVR